MSNISDLYNVTGAVFVVEDGLGGHVLLEIPNCRTVSLSLEVPYVNVTALGDTHHNYLPHPNDPITVTLTMLVEQNYQFHLGRTVVRPNRAPSGIWLPNTAIEVVGVPTSELQGL